MSDSIDNALPTLQELREADPEGFVLQVTPDQGLSVSLLSAREGVAMNARYECYSLALALPLGVQLPQAVLNLYGPGRTQPWVLMLSPVMPEPDGRHVLEAVIHRSRAVGDAH